jgi:hypothetical protein
MRVLLGFLWAVILFICTCTANFQALITDHFIRFFFTGHPHWEDLLKINDINLHDKFYVIQKIGHFSGFFLLALILTVLGRRRSGIYLSIGYAVSTEILQLYFYRDGRIVDMFIDTFGILLAYVLCNWIGTRKKRHFRNNQVG